MTPRRCDGVHLLDPPAESADAAELQRLERAVLNAFDLGRGVMTINKGHRLLRLPNATSTHTRRHRLVAARAT